MSLYTAYEAGLSERETAWYVVNGHVVPGYELTEEDVDDLLWGTGNSHGPYSSWEEANAAA